MQQSLSDLSVAQLQRAIVIKQKIESLEAELAAVFAGVETRLGRTRRGSRSRGRPLTVAVPEPAPATAKPKAKRKVNAVLSKRLSELAKARWKKVKAAGKSRL